MTHRIAFLLLGLVLAGSAAAADDAVHDRSTFIGGNVAISEAVVGPLFAVGGNVTVTAPVSGPVHIAGGNVMIASSAPITGDVGVAGGEVKLNGSIDGRLRAAGGTVRIDGPVKGDASVAAGRLELGPGARIQGKLTFRGDDLQQDPAAQVVGGIVHEAGYRDWHQHSAGNGFLHGWFWTAGLMVLAAILAAALPDVSSRMARELRENPGATLLSGFLAFTAIPIAGVLLMLTIVGIPIALLALMAYGIVLLTGYAWVAVIVGGMVLDRVKPQVAALAAWRSGAALLAMLAIALVARVPYIGGWAQFAALVLGVGMIAAAVFRPRSSSEALPA